MTTCTLTPGATLDTTKCCPSCSSCLSSASPLSQSTDRWRLIRCGHCGFVLLENPPPVEALRDEFNWTATFRLEEERRRAARPVLNRISHGWKHWRGKWLPRRKLDRLLQRYVSSGRVLDVGCGSGHQLERLPPQLIPCGIEIDSEAIVAARHRVEPRGGFVVQADALRGLQACESGSMAAVIMHSFLEHEVSPLEVLTQVHRILEPSGVCIIKVPNFDCWNRRYWRRHDWPGFRFPDHVNYFTPHTLLALVHRSGLRVARFRWTDRLPTSDNMWLVAGRSL